MIATFHNTRLAPQRFNHYLEACAREGRAIERAVGRDCASSYPKGSPMSITV